MPTSEEFQKLLEEADKKSDDNKKLSDEEK